jgi:PAS domain S-box-containing protein
VGGNQLGNLFLGQFFFDDEKPDRELFTRQAKRYGFDEKEYLSALDRVPRFSRDTVDTVMRFYTKFIDLISTLSYGNVRLARTLSERDLLLESLKKSEERFRTIFNNINDAVQIHEIGPDGKPGRFLDVNDAACRMLMVSREELLAHDPLDYATEYHNPPLKEVVRLLKKNGTATFETGHRRSDGIVVPVEINAHVISLMGKTVVLSVIRDISYRKKAEEEIRFANVILTTQQETSPDGILVVDEQGKILSFNRKFTEIWGIPQDVIDSRSDERALSFVIEKLSDPQEFLARVRYLYDNRDEKSIEEVLLKDSRVLKRYSAPMFGEDNRYYGRVWYFHDITDRKKAEQAIIRIAREWEATFNATSDGICLIDADQNIQRCNKRMGEILGGMKHEDFAGKPCWAIVHKTTGPIPDCPFVSAKETLTRTRVELPAGDLWFEVTADPILDSSGKFTGAVHIMRDITERKMAEDALRTSEEKYRTLFENMLEGFAYCRMVYDEKGHPVDFIYLNVNPAFDRIAGTKTVVGKPVTKVFPGIKEAFPSLFEIYGRVALTGEPESFDLDFKPSGKWLHISVNSPAKEHFVAVFEDITERKQMEDALRESRQLFADIIGFLPDATLVVDRDGKVIAWNRAIELLSGIPVQDMVGKGDYEYSIWETGTKRPILIDLVLHPDENYIQSHYIKVRRDGNTITAETDFVRADGRIMAQGSREPPRTDKRRPRQPCAGTNEGP